MVTRPRRRGPRSVAPTRSRRSVPRAERISWSASAARRKRPLGVRPSPAAAKSRRSGQPGVEVRTALDVDRARRADPRGNGRGRLGLDGLDQGRQAGPGASSPTGRSGRGAARRSARGTAARLPSGSGRRRRRHRPDRTGTGSSRRPAGSAPGRSWPGRRATIATRPSSSGWRSASSTGRSNSAQLVEEQHALVRERDLAGRESRAAADHAGVRRSVWCGARNGGVRTQAR